MMNHTDITKVPAPTLAKIVVRGAVALLLPAVLFSALAGACAGVAWRVFQLIGG